LENLDLSMPPFRRKLSKMKSTALALLVPMLTLLVTHAEERTELNSRKDRESYALGEYIGRHWKAEGIETNDLNWNLVTNALHARLAGAPTLLDDKQTREAMRTLSSDLFARHFQKQQAMAQKNKAEGDAFLAQNKLKPGVHTLPSGLQYRVLAEGAGAHPTTNDLVVLNYRGAFVDGREFVNSAKVNPSRMPVPLAGTKGWMEALQLMKPGDHWDVVIPPELGHGERGSYPLVGPNATLRYDIELVSIQPRQARLSGKPARR
jgi:FKBP-type peptidyl-prolyl cis-trans isomerase FklB